MAQCVNGHSITESARFCPECGEPNRESALRSPTGTPYAPARTNGFAVASLVLALVGITIPALICGYLGRRQIDQSRGTERGRSLAVAGIILGWLQVAAGIALLALLVVLALNANDDTTTAIDSTSTATAPSPNRETTVTGTPLPALEVGQDPAVGAPAPVVQGSTFDGEPVNLGGPSETASLVVFMPHWCPHCQAELPQLVQWASDGTIPNDVRLVAVATSTDPAQPNYPPQDWFEREGWADEVLVDSDDNAAAAAYGVTGFPFFVAIRADGTIAARASGELDQASVTRISASVSD